MPPKPKFTRDEIVNKALEIVKNNGIEALTARELGKRLGTSSSPVFTSFKDMDELKSAVRKKADSIFKSYMAVAETFNPAYKKRGMQWIKFAKENPKLFQMLFMRKSEDSDNLDSTLSYSLTGKQDDIQIIMRDYKATCEQSEHLFKQMWVYTYGLCSLCANGICSLTDDEIAIQMGEVFSGMIYVIKSGTDDFAKVVPADENSPDSGKIKKKYPNLSENTEMKK